MAFVSIAVSAIVISSGRQRAAEPGYCPGFLTTDHWACSGGPIGQVGGCGCLIAELYHLFQFLSPGTDRKVFNFTEIFYNASAEETIDIVQ